MNIVVIEGFLIDLNHRCCPKAFVDVVEMITKVFCDVVLDAIADDLTDLEKKHNEIMLSQFFFEFSAEFLTYFIVLLYQKIGVLNHGGFVGFFFGVKI